MAVAAAAPARLLAGPKEERLLSLVHTHTGERLTVPYFADGRYLSEGLAALDGFLRDFRTGEMHPIEPSLFDLLNDLRLATGARSPFQVISAYRSPRTNAMLREHSHGVASGSLHLQGRAIDVRLADVGTASLRDAALELARGGRRLLPRARLRARGHGPRPALVGRAPAGRNRIARRACLRASLARTSGAREAGAHPRPVKRRSRPMRSLVLSTVRPVAVALAALLAAPPAFARSVRCESRDYRYTYCRVDTYGDVRLRNEWSRFSCHFGRSWGYDHRGVWVDRGCRAEFAVDENRRG